jgi:hypothetical protein
MGVCLMDTITKTSFIILALVILYNIVNDIVLIIKHPNKQVIKVFPAEDRKTWFGRYSFYTTTLFSLLLVKWDDEE